MIQLRFVGPFRWSAIGIAAACFAVGGHARAGDFTFTGIGDLHGGGFSSGAFGVSPDGAVVLGSSVMDDDGAVGAFWTWSGGLVSIGRLAALGTTTVARACTDDATVIIGESNERAFMWTKEDGMKDLGTLAPKGAGFATAWDLTPEGDVIVGTAQAEMGSDAFRVVAGVGMVSAGYSGATAVSADGRAMAVIQSSGNGLNAFLAREGQEAVSLGDLPGGLVLTQPTAMTNDAGVIVGYSRSRRIPGGNSSGVNEAFVWRESTGMVGLGNFEQTGFSQSQALDVSEDGRIIVGLGTRAFAQQAAIWIDGGPILHLRSYLLSLGIEEVEGWTLTSATGISADGRTIVGTGLNPKGLAEGWVVRIPAPGAAAVMALGVWVKARRRR